MGAEAHVQHAICLAWGAHPRLRFWRANVGVGWFANGQPARKTDPGAYPVRFGQKGQGDLSGVIDGGRRLEIECKAPGETQAPEQKIFQAMIERFGGVYILAYSLDDADRAFAKIGITR